MEGVAVSRGLEAANGLNLNRAGKRMRNPTPFKGPGSLRPNDLSIVVRNFSRHPQKNSNLDRESAFSIGSQREPWCRHYDLL